MALIGMGRSYSLVQTNCLICKLDWYRAGSNCCLDDCDDLVLACLRAKRRMTAFQPPKLLNKCIILGLPHHRNLGEERNTRLLDIADVEFVRRGPLGEAAPDKSSTSNLKTWSKNTP